MEEQVADKSRIHIGRYEVVGRIAVGGMAEILLARLVGPQGFERPIVIKRILPHLVQRPQFLTMMTDEARIAARIQHPNVVQIHELIEHEGVPHIVMEYLPGESLADLLAQLSDDKLQLQLPLALHIVAEAAAGLHEAHELREPDGTPLDVVHRDVSPHNIFVTDEGAVKVLDFGIVKAATRLTRTATGQLKGKYRYLAPEQCNAKPIDRRADIFALGVVLYEATTGTKLFERDNELLTLKAIMMEPVTPPSEVVKGYPKALEKVVMRALERDPSKRFATADAFRQKLVRIANEMTGPVLPDRGLRGLMQRVFRQRIEDRKELLRRLQTESGSMGMKMAELRDALDHTRSGVIVAPERLMDLASDDAERQAKQRRRRALALGGLVALAVTLVALGWFARGESPPAPVEPEPPAPVATESVSEPAEAPVDEGVWIVVLTNPEAAQVRRAGVLLGRTPLQQRLERGSEAVVFDVALEGYESRQVEVVPDIDQRLALELVPIVVEPAETMVEAPAVMRPRRVRRRRRPSRARMTEVMSADRDFRRFD